MMKSCEFCKKEFLASHKIRKFCSRECFGKSYKSMHAREMRGCLVCKVGINVLLKSKRKFCSVNCKNDFYKEKFSGEGNPNFGNRIPNMFKHTKLAKKKIKEAVSSQWETEGRMRKHLDALERFKKKHGFFPMSSPAAREKISVSSMNRVTNDKNVTWKNCKRGYYISTKSNKNEYYHSSYELKRMKELDDDVTVKSWTKKHGIVIKYGSARRYYPDFYIETSNGVIILEEIKAYIKDVDEFIKKALSTKSYCDKKQITFIVNFPNKKHKEMYSGILKML